MGSRERVLAAGARAFGLPGCAHQGCDQPHHPDLALFCGPHTRMMTRAEPDQCIACGAAREGSHDLWCAGCAAKLGRA